MRRWKVIDIGDGDSYATLGDILTLQHDDNSCSPFFMMCGGPVESPSLLIVL